MILANYLVALLVFGLGAYVLVTRRNLFKIVMGLSLMESASYLLALSVAYRDHSTAPVLLRPPHGATPHQLSRGNVADPVLQNMCLTAIVIGVAVTAVLLVTVVRLAQHYDTLDADEIRELRG